MSRVVTKVQPGFKAYHEPYNKAITGMQGQWNSINKDTKIYKTYDLHRQQKAMDNYYDHMRLDEEFLDTSPEWSKRFRERELVTQRQASLHTNDKVKNHYLYPRYKHNMNDINLKKLSENDVRESHAWAEQQLLGHRGETHQLACAAQKRIVQFSDWVGITDRFTGYRQNLNRTNQSDLVSMVGRDTAGLPHKTWATESSKTRLPPKRFQLAQQFENAESIGVRPPFGTASHSPIVLPIMTPEEKHLAQTYSKTPQEWSGIQNTYPGVSEYRQTYSVHHLQKQRDVHSTDYTINPMPDFGLLGKAAVYPLSHYATPSTENNIRYGWPDSNQIRTKPFVIGNSVTKYNPPGLWDR